MAKARKFDIGQQVWVLGGAFGDRPGEVVDFDPKRPSRRTGGTRPCYDVLTDGQRRWVHPDNLASEKPRSYNRLIGR